MTFESDVKRLATEKDFTSGEEILKVKTYDSFERLGEIQQQWDQFLESIGGGIFLTYDWCRIWWKYYGKDRDLRVHIFSNKNDIVGIIPLFFEKIRLGPVLGRVGKIVGSDSTLGQFVLPLAKEYIENIIKEFSKVISKDKWDILHIGPLTGLFDNTDEIAALCSQYLGSRYEIRSEEKGVQTYFKLADSWEGQLSELSKNQRKKFRKNDKAIQSGKMCLVSTLADNGDFGDMFDGFIRLHQSRWSKMGLGGHFEDWPYAYEFHRDVAAAQLKQKRLRLLEVKLDENIIGYKYGFRFGDKHYAFLDARSVTQPEHNLDFGKILFSEQVKNIQKENNIKYMDSMRGKYEHKLRLGGMLLPIKSVYIYPRKKSVLIRVYIFRALAWALNLCYYRIWYCTLSRKLPFKNKPLWQIWIKTCSFV